MSFVREELGRQGYTYICPKYFLAIQFQDETQYTVCSWMLRADGD